MVGDPILNKARRDLHGHLIGLTVFPLEVLKPVPVIKITHLGAQRFQDPCHNFIRHDSPPSYFGNPIYIFRERRDIRFQKRGENFSSSKFEIWGLWKHQETPNFKFETLSTSKPITNKRLLSSKKTTWSFHPQKNPFWKNKSYPHLSTVCRGRLVMLAKRVKFFWIFFLSIVNMWISVMIFFAVGVLTIFRDEVNTPPVAIVLKNSLFFGVFHETNVPTQ